MLKWRTNEKTGRQHPAYHRQPPGGTRHCTRRWWMKRQFFDILHVVGFYGFHQPVQSMLLICLATISCRLVPSGCINSTHCQWWSRLFWIGQLVWDEVGSLSKTTKLLLLDSLLQEVCIESGSDGSLALSSLGLSVCLVSHNLLYSGLKKAPLKMRTKSTIQV